MRYRLRMYELIPREMSQYRIVDGRAHFVAAKLFEVSLCVKGAKKDDGWFFVDVEFLFNVGGDVTGMQGTYFEAMARRISLIFRAEFPRRPTGLLKRHISDEANARLGFYLPPEEVPPETAAMEPPRPQLPEGFVDAPLVRLFNFLRTYCTVASVLVLIMSRNDVALVPA